MKKMKKLMLIMGMFVVVMLAGCTEADRVNQNIRNEADHFNLYRRVAVINMLDNEPLFELTGFFSLEDRDHRITVTVQTGSDSFARHIINVNELTFWIVEDLNDISVDPYSFSLVIQPPNFRVFENETREYRYDFESLNEE